MAEQKTSIIRDYLSTTDHKKIGILYLWFSLFMAVFGGAFAGLIRLQLSHAGASYLKPEFYNSMLSMHATLMIFFVIIPAFTGFGNYFVPLLVGARVVTRPNLAGTGLMLARYLLPGFLLVSLALGVAAQALVSRAATERGRNLRRGAVLGVLVLAYLLGPLPHIHGGVNSFTKHPAFQASYAEPDPERVLPDPLDDGSTPVTRSELQPFYAQLAREGGTAPIIEYPFLLGEDANLYYFAQRLHQRPVLAGYYRSGAGEADVFGLAVGPRVGPPAASPGYITNAMMVDHVLGRGPSDGRVRFRTVVDILDAATVAASGAEYLVVHANLLREFFKIGPAGAGSELALRVRQSLVARYGAPVFENQLLTVLRLPRP